MTSDNRSQNRFTNLLMILIVGWLIAPFIIRLIGPSIQLEYGSDTTLAFMEMMLVSILLAWLSPTIFAAIFLYFGLPLDFVVIMTWPAAVAAALLALLPMWLAGRRGKSKIQFWCAGTVSPLGTIIYLASVR